MPARVHSIASQEQDSNRLSGIISVLANLLTHDQKTTYAYLCHDDIEHIYKARGEGDHFCGYRNIQMLLCGVDAKSTRSDLVTSQGRHTVLQLQALIEDAWAAGFNSDGLIETGGIRDTRKHIGTAEVSTSLLSSLPTMAEHPLQAQALLQYLGIAGPAKAFSNTSKGSKTAYLDLLDYVEAYFSSSGIADATSKVHRTSLGPIYLQRPRHSLTIVGIQRRHDGSRALIVFDPAYSPPKALVNAIKVKVETKKPDSVLKAYLRKERYLRRYRGFETIGVSMSAAEG